MDLFEKYPAGEVIIIILLVIMLSGQIASAIRNILALKKDASKPMEDLQAVVDNHTQRMDSMEKTLKDVRDDLNELHAKDSKRERDEKSEQRAILALLNHALTGNNEKEMESAKADLNEVVWGDER